MSKKSAVEFIKKMQTDATFRGKINGFKTAKDKLADFIKKQGFDFTKKDLAEAKEGFKQSELSESELALVAGGYYEPDEGECEGHGCSPCCYNRWH